MKDLFDYRFELLEREMETVQGGIETYNRTIFAVKGLAMTLFTAFIAFVSSLSAKPGWVIFLAMGIILLLFWVLDAIFKSIQMVYITRSRDIEAKLRESGFYKRLADDSIEDFDFPRIEEAFKEWDDNKFRHFRPEFTRPTVWLIYVALIALNTAIGLFL